MNFAVVTWSVLFFSSLMLSISLTLAWRECGRPRHARTWALAFGVATLQWVVNLVDMLLISGRIPAVIALTSVMMMVTSALYASGCRQRAGRADRRKGFLLAILGGTAIILFVTYAVPHVGARAAVPDLFTAAMLGLCAFSIAPRKRPPFGAEITMIVVFALFALFELGLGGLGLAMGARGVPALGRLYRTVIETGLPACYISTGVAAILLLASDLSHQLRRLAASDPLTGILNRRGFEEATERSIANVRRYGLPLTVAIADLDHFKTVNDRFGHAAGDIALQRFAALVHGEIRSGDIFARIGGEEFGLVFVGTTAQATAEALDRLRVTIAEMPIDGEFPFSLTVSFGIAELEEGDEGLAPILVRADRALYRAKQEGRNRVAVAGTVETVADPLIGRPVLGFG